MSNEHNHSTSSDDEYQYPNEEYIDSSSTEEQVSSDEAEESTEPSSSFMQPVIAFVKNNKRPSIIMVIALMVLVAFAIMHKSNKIIIEDNPPKPSAPVQKSQPAQVTVMPKNNSLDSASAYQLNTIKAESQRSAATVSALKNQVQSMQDQLKKSDATNQKLNEALGLLVEQVNTLNKKINMPVAHKKHTPPPLTYHIKAIIPGRAWVKSSEGLSQSITVGDSVPNYGKIKIIDPDHGMILTSSGKLIRYGENDS